MIASVSRTDLEVAIRNDCFLVVVVIISRTPFQTSREKPLNVSRVLEKEKVLFSLIVLDEKQRRSARRTKGSFGLSLTVGVDEIAILPCGFGCLGLCLVWGGGRGGGGWP